MARSPSEDPRLNRVGKLRVFIVSVFFLSLPFLFTHHAQHRFKRPSSLTTVPFNPSWEIPPMTSSEKEEVFSILSSPCRYLNRGNQSYVFETKDGKYVIKLFRYRSTRFPFLQQMKALVNGCYHKKVKDPLPLKINKTFGAARLAFTEAKPFTQIVFCHLNLTNNQLPITQFKIGKTSYRLAMDRCRFVIQKKVTPFSIAMLEAREDPAQMHFQIDSLISLFIERTAKGIRNSDPNLAPNFGFLEGKAVEIDFGNYRKIVMDPKIRFSEINNFMTRFRHWLIKNAPEYIGYLDQKFIKIKEVL